MMKVLLVSPHFDDAILSAGQFMADRADTEVVTVFGGFPTNAPTVVTPYDQKCGFQNALQAVSARRIENNEATALLEATSLELEFTDSQYNEPTTVEAVTAALQELINKNDYEFVMAPLGLGHPDHLLVSEAVMRLETNRKVYLWEDLPLRVVEPELVFERTQQLNLIPSLMMKPATTGDKMAKKIRAMLCYKSQVGTGILDPYLMYVPERFWRFK